jgi:hypothetical protein
MFKFVVRLSLLVAIAFVPVVATGQAETVKLYSPLKHQGENLRYCLNFLRVGGPRFDFCYGHLYAGEDLDWFQTAISAGSRTLIKDLGAHTWSDEVKVSVVEPLPKLAPGEQRQVFVDTSGADGAPGAPGTPGMNGGSISSRPSDRVVDVRSLEWPLHRAPVPATPLPPAPAQKKNDGKTKVSPVFVKAVVGHLYVIHVVDDLSDYYALFRVDALERGDNCTISWKLIEVPQSVIGNREK